MAKIFISYSRADRQFLTELTPLLHTVYRNHIIWYDKEISGGEEWWQGILRQIAECDIFVYLVSNDSLASPHCGDELREALRLNKISLAVVVRPQTDIEGKAPQDLKQELSVKQRVDMSSGFRDFEATAELYGAINGLLTKAAYGSPSEPSLSGLDDTEKRELEDSFKRWNKNKTGDIYWLASDLTVAGPVARDSSPQMVKHYIRQTYWHANQLALGEPIEGRFHQLCEKAKLFSDSDWNNPESRQEIVNELGALLHAIAFIMEGADKEFVGNPPEDWPNC